MDTKKNRRYDNLEQKNFLFCSVLRLMFEGSGTSNYQTGSNERTKLQRLVSTANLSDRMRQRATPFEMIMSLVQTDVSTVAYAFC